MKTDLQMDGIYTRGNLCFVLSQFDRKFNAREYLENNPRLRQSLRPLYADLKKTLDVIKDRKRELIETQQSRGRHQTSISNLEAQIGQAKVSLKRKHGAEDGCFGKYLALAILNAAFNDDLRSSSKSSSR
jgi:hypothetical protein